MKHFLKLPNSQQGQTLVIMMLVLVVVLTIGLSAVSRTITNVKESSTSERSSRAFSAAEAGIESTLRQDLPKLLQGAPNNVASLNLDVGTGKTTVTISKSGGSADAAYQPSKPVPKDDTIQIDLTGYSGNVIINWTSKSASGDTNAAGTCATATSQSGAAALEVLVVKDSSANYAVTRYNYEPLGCSTANNNFTTGQSVTGDFVGQATIPITAGTALMRIRPLYNQATVKIAPPPGGTLPVQAYKIRSEGVSGDTKRVVEVEKTIGGLPSVFDYVLFNGSTTCPLTKTPGPGC